MFLATMNAGVGKSLEGAQGHVHVSRKPEVARDCPVLGDNFNRRFHFVSRDVAFRNNYSHDYHQIQKEKLFEPIP